MNSIKVSHSHFSTTFAARMAYILSIETATKACSVAIHKNENCISIVEHTDEGYTHAENLSIFIDQALEKTHLNYNDLNAVAISKGPGSYTGLRIGTSTAKGLCYALDIPLISVSTLQAMAHGVATNSNTNIQFFCPMIDARRMEVYAAFYDHSNNQVRDIEADIIDANSYQTYLDHSTVAFFGDGAAKCKEVLGKQKNASFIDDFHPSAQFVGVLACQKFIQKDFENTAYFEPYYLKDFVAGKPKKLV